MTERQTQTENAVARLGQTAQRKAPAPMVAGAWISQIATALRTVTVRASDPDRQEHETRAWNDLRRYLARALDSEPDARDDAPLEPDVRTADVGDFDTDDLLGTLVERGDDPLTGRVEIRGDTLYYLGEPVADLRSRETCGAGAVPRFRDAVHLAARVGRV